MRFCLLTWILSSTATFIYSTSIDLPHPNLLTAGLVPQPDRSICSSLNADSEVEANHSPPVNRSSYDELNSNTSTIYCSYTTSDFFEERGIAVITKFEAAPELSNAIFDSVAIPMVPSPPPFEVKELPGRGIGVVANRTISRGELLFAYPPLGVFHESLMAEEHESIVAKSINFLPQESRSLFWDLTSFIDAPGRETAIGIFDTNSFHVSVLGEDHAIIVPETARINHDCRPNTIYYVENLIHYTYAVRTIRAGEEITNTYIPPVRTYEDRQLAIENNWGFKCACSHCSKSLCLREESDTRIRFIKSLHDEFKNIANSDTYIEDMTAKAELLVSLYEQESLWGVIGDAYLTAALSFSRAGKHWEAQKWTMKASDALVLAKGSNNTLIEALELVTRLN